MKNNLNKLIALFSKYNINGYLCPYNDEYYNEFLPPHKKRLKYITGFSGSNGLAIILPKFGLFFTDDRYIIQSEQEIDTSFFTLYNIKDIDKTLKMLQISKYKIGFNANLFTKNHLQNLQHLTLIKLEYNLIDEIYKSPATNIVKNIFEYNIHCTGKSRQKKIQQLRMDMKNIVDYQIITDSSIILWLLNLRCMNHIKTYNPIFDCHCIISLSEIILYANTGIIDLLKELNNDLILKQEEEFFKDISNLNGVVSVDPKTASISIYDYLNSVEIKNHSMSYYLARAKKHDIEIRVNQKIHIIESIVICELLAWLENTIKKSTITEYQIGLKLYEFRSKYSEYISESFPTICGYQENSAIIHYIPQSHNAKIIKPVGILLLDTGAQYIGGTTDTTRTITLSDIPTHSQKEHYTRVLAGHLDIAKLKFKKGITGKQLDILGRMHLWNNYLDYEHSTGHGVGNFLNVHEGPIAINRYNDIPLEKNMILSNEPGVYFKDQYGIRIENLVYVKESKNNNFLEFENLILVPYCKKLILLELLSHDQKKYLSQYQDKITKNVYNHLSDIGKKWFMKNII